MRRPRWDAKQLTIDWAEAAGRPLTVVVPRPPAWDFRTTFPPVLQEVIDAGTVDAADAGPDRLAGLHVAHGAALHQALIDLDRYHDARRRGGDPTTGKVPHRLAKRAALPTKLSHEIERLDRWWQTLLAVYAETFGDEATTSFGEHVKTTHAGVELVNPVEANTTTRPNGQRISSPL